MYACAQSCPTLCDPIDCSPPGSFDLGFYQTRILEWFAISISFSGDLPNPGLKPVSPALPGKFFTTEVPEKPHGFNLKGIKLKATKVLLLYWPRLKFSTESLKYKIQYSKESLCCLWQ